MPPYDAYAPIYDATGQGHAGARHADAVLAWLHTYGEKPRSALDLACGAGAATLVLARAGIRTLGMDCAPAMLAIAAGRARDAGLEVGLAEGDIRLRLQVPWWSMSITEPPTTESPPLAITEPPTTESPPLAVDLVTCFGALEELTDEGDLTRLLSDSATLLRPSGHVAFDLPAPGWLDRLDDTDEALHDGPDHMVLARYMRDGDVTASRRVIWFVREIERWWRGEESHALREWRVEDVTAALAIAGLEPCTQLPAAPDSHGRVLYVARRK